MESAVERFLKKSRKRGVNITVHSRKTIIDFRITGYFEMWQETLPRSKRSLVAKQKRVENEKKIQ